jgi:hypothetical protein
MDFANRMEFVKVNPAPWVWSRTKLNGSNFSCTHKYFETVKYIRDIRLEHEEALELAMDTAPYIIPDPKLC